MRALKNKLKSANIDPVELMKSKGKKKGSKD